MARDFTKAMSRDPLEDIDWPDWEAAGDMAEPVPAPPAEDTEVPAEEELIEVQSAKDTEPPAVGQAIEVQLAEDIALLAEEKAIEAQPSEDRALLDEKEAIDVQLAEDIALLLLAEEEVIAAQRAEDTALLDEEEAIEAQPTEDIERPDERETIAAQPVEDRALLAEEEAIEVQPAEDTALPAAGEAIDLQPAANQMDALAEIEAMEATADREIESGPEAQEDQADTLSQLVATIDQEIEQALGSEAIAALVSAAPARESGEEQYAIFTLAGTEYAVPLGSVLEIGRPPNATPVPNVPDWVLGVANLRGDIISMVDLRAFLGIQRRSFGRDSRILVVQAHQAVVTTGLLVDQLNGIGYLAEDRIGPPHGPIEDQVTPYLRGVYEHEERLLVVLDLDGLLLSPEMRQFEPM
jgi:purine-binding chemotaxis protein CheW